MIEFLVVKIWLITCLRLLISYVSIVYSQSCCIFVLCFQHCFSIIFAKYKDSVNCQKERMKYAIWHPTVNVFRNYAL